MKKQEKKKGPQKFSSAASCREKALQDILKYGVNLKFAANREIKGGRKIIALVTGHMSPFVTEIYSGLEQKVMLNDPQSYGLENYATHYYETVKNQVLGRILYGKKADCVVMVSMWPDAEMVSQFKKRSIPLIIVEKKVSGTSSLTVDNFKGAYRAADFLAKKGRKRIALIRGENLKLSTGELVVDVMDERQQGYMAALKDNSIEFDRKLVIITSHCMFEEGFQVFGQMQLDNTGADAVFFASGDLVAMGYMEAARKNRINIPGDVSVIGYDDAFLLPVGQPALTTIRQPARKIGEAAFDLARGMIEGKIKGNKNIVFEPELIIRESA